MRSTSIRNCCELIKTEFAGCLSPFHAGMSWFMNICPRLTPGPKVDLAQSGVGPLAAPRNFRLQPGPFCCTRFNEKASTAIGTTKQRRPTAAWCLCRRKKLKTYTHCARKICNLRWKCKNVFLMWNNKKLPSNGNLTLCFPPFNRLGRPC